jgi:hypothetical protein
MELTKIFKQVAIVVLIVSFFVPEARRMYKGVKATLIHYHIIVPHLIGRNQGIW